MHVLYFLLGAFCGGFVGMLMAAVCAAAALEDERNARLACRRREWNRPPREDMNVAAD